MAMMSSGSRAEMNVTPMIDILLVLLIICLVLLPAKPVGEDALLPQPNPNHPENKNPEDIVVLEVLSGNPGGKTRLAINKQEVAWPALHDELERIYLHRATKVMYLRADADLDFEPVADAIDIAHNAGVTQVALMTEKP